MIIKRKFYKLKKLLELCRISLSADKLKKGKDWNGYKVYEPVYKCEFIGGLPRVVLIKDEDVRISTFEECFKYMEFVRNDKKK